MKIKCTKNILPDVFVVVGIISVDNVVPAISFDCFSTEFAVTDCPAMPIVFSLNVVSFWLNSFDEVVLSAKQLFLNYQIKRCYKIIYYWITWSSDIAFNKILIVTNNERSFEIFLLKMVSLCPASSQGRCLDSFSTCFLSFSDEIQFNSIMFHVCKVCQHFPFSTSKCLMCDWSFLVGALGSSGLAPEPAPTAP